MTELSELIVNAKADLDALKADSNLALLHEHGWKYMPTDGSNPGNLMLPFALTEGVVGSFGGRSGIYPHLAAIGKQEQDPYAAIGTTRESFSALTAPLYRRAAELILMNYDRDVAGWEDRLLFGTYASLDEFQETFFPIPSLKYILERHGGAENLSVDPSRVEAATQTAIKLQFQKTIDIYRDFAAKGRWDESVILGDPNYPDELQHESRNSQHGKFVPLTKLVELVGGDYDKVPKEFKDIVNEEFLTALKNDGPSDEVRNLMSEISYQETISHAFEAYVNKHYGGNVLAFNFDRDKIEVVDRSYLVGRQYTDFNDMVEKRNSGLLDKVLEVSGKSTLEDAYGALDKYIHDIPDRMKYLEDVSVSLNGNEWRLGDPIPKPIVAKGFDEYGNKILRTQPANKSGGDLNM